jgi:hypothetical protein
MKMGKCENKQMRLRPRLAYLLSFCIFPFAFCISMAAHDAPFNADDPSYLRRQYVWFLAQEPVRQQQLRKLHTDFQELGPEDQTRFTRIMQAYNAWLARLPDEDRQRVLSAPSAAARLDEVKKLREREWVESLPKPYRDEYAKLNGDDRRQKVQEWRAEESERRDEWAVAKNNWEQFQPGKLPPMFLGDGRAQIDIFVSHLKENLTDFERKELDDSKSAFDEFGNLFWYPREIVRLADQHPPLPGIKVGPKDWESLPVEVRTFLTKNDRHFNKKKGPIFAGEELKEIRRAQGRWPEFGIELAKYCQKIGLKLPMPLGDCRKDQMPPEVKTFLDKTLEPLLKKSVESRADLDALTKAEGSWPEYPRMIIDLAKKYKQLPVPGWTLPGPPQAWDRLRAVKPRPKP